MKEAVTKVIDTLTQEDFHGAFQKLLERYNKCIATGGDSFEWDKSFMYVLSKKVPIRKNLKTYLMFLESYKKHSISLRDLCLLGGTVKFILNSSAHSWRIEKSRPCN